MVDGTGPVMMSLDNLRKDGVFAFGKVESAIPLGPPCENTSRLPVY